MQMIGGLAMKNRLQRYFALTDKGINNALKASIYSLLKFFSFVLPPMLVFMFLQDMISGSLRHPAVYVGALAGITAVMYLILSKEYTFCYDVTYEESADLRIDLANKFRKLPLSYFSTHNLSDLSQTVMMDVNNIEMAISHALPQGIGFFYFFLLVTIALVINSPILGLTVTLPIWLSIVIMILTGNLQTRQASRYYARLLENASGFQEAFEMQQEIKSYSMQDAVENEVYKKLDDTEKIHIRAEFTMAVASSLISLLPYLAPVLTAIIGAILYSEGSLSLLYYVGYLMAATNIASQYTVLNEFLLMFFYFKDSFRRIRELRGEKVQEGEDLPIPHYDVCLSNVEFGYGENKVIKGVSIHAKQGEVTALVGPSGCGKTTVLRLISRLYDYDSGEITVGGTDIKKISTDALFEKISIVFQNVELFNQSVMENIRIGRKTATDEEVLQAARLANVDKFVENLPDGYDTLIGENGSKLSGGERQRISIARAFLKNAPIILLDEISASIDVENEMEIQNSINRLIADKTVIVISHRLKSIEKADQIVVLDDGKVESVGTHEELLLRSKVYRSMVEKSSLAEAYIY